jgi:hypothetical protein
MARRTAPHVDWDGLFRRWRGSGLTQAEFCSRHRIPIHSFRYRLYRSDARTAALVADRPAASTRPAPSPDGERTTDFLPVRVVDVVRPQEDSSAPASPGRPVEVILDGGRRIAVPPGFDADTLLRVVAILEHRRC